MAALAALAAVGWLAGCGDGAPSAFDDQSGGLIQVSAPPTTAPPTTPATTVPPTSTLVPIDPVDGCFDYLSFQIAAEDPDTLDLWDELGQDEGALRDECVRLAEEDPERVAQMVEDKRAIDAYLAAVSGATESTDVATATTEG